MKVTGRLEFHSENGRCPHFVILEGDNGMKLTLAYPTAEIAEEKMPKLVSEWNARNGE